jgi:uncharacterized OsmC-like protein
VAAGDGKLVGEVVGEVEKENGVLVLRRIRVTYHLDAPQEQWEVVERVHEMHKDYCPVFRSIERAVTITTELERAPGGNS